MRMRSFFIAFVAALVTAGASALTGATPRADEGHDDSTLLGTWVINFIVPVSPKGNDFGQPHRHPFTFIEEDGERVVTAKEVFDIRVPGVWRLSGNEFSAAFEFTCPEGTICGSVTMRGTITGEKEMRGRVIVIWDEDDSATPTGYDTVTGTFTGEKCDRTARSIGGDVSAQHDTGGCETVK
jgi:hypothetical protein